MAVDRDSARRARMLVGTVGLGTLGEILRRRARSRPRPPARIDFTASRLTDAQAAAPGPAAIHAQAAPGEADDLEPFAGVPETEPSLGLLDDTAPAAAPDADADIAADTDDGIWPLPPHR